MSHAPVRPCMVTIRDFFRIRLRNNGGSHVHLLVTLAWLSAFVKAFITFSNYVTHLSRQLMGYITMLAIRKIRSRLANLIEFPAMRMI